MIIENNSFNNTDFNNFSNWFVGLDLSQFLPMVIEGPERPDSFQNDDWRLPKSFKAVDLFGEGYPQEPGKGGVLDTIYTFVQSISEGIETQIGLAAYYPTGGHIGWHTNSNFLGYNILLTYSQTGDSFFEYVNSDGDITRINDPVGWSYKITEWGQGADKVWHRAHAECNRLTITFFSKELDNIMEIKNDL